MTNLSTVSATLADFTTDAKVYPSGTILNVIDKGMNKTGDGVNTFASLPYSVLFSDVASKPTTVTGYGITDAMATSHAANTITGLGATTTALTSGGTGAQGTSTVLARQDHTHTLPAYPTTLPASDVSAWAKAATKPAYTAAEVAALATAGGTMTGAITALRETKVALPANAIDLATGNLFTKTITVATTFTVSNVLASGNANSFILELTNGGAFTITWFAGVKWAGGTAPTLTAAGVDILGFYSHDGGTTWRGIVMAKDSK